MESNVLSLRGIQKGYRLGNTDVPVLRDLDLELHAGERFAVMGPSGVGKSTLLSCIAGLEGTDAGTIVVLGTDLASLDDEQRTKARRRLGIIYQFFALVPHLSVWENVALPYLIEGLAPDEGAVDTMLARVGLEARAAHLPSQLSGGEMQLAAIARALVRRPRLVIADEPTGSLNVATGKRVLHVLFDVLEEQGAALLLVTHQPEHAAHADRVCFLLDGQLRETLEAGEVSNESVHAAMRRLGI